MNHKKRMHVLACVLYFALLFSMVPRETSALQVPKLMGRVNDYAQMLSPSTVKQLDAALRELERTESTQIVVLTVRSLEGDSLEEFSIRVAEQWKIGQKGLDNGAVLIISKKDRKIRIEVGYGLEGKMTDLVAGRIVRDVIAPRFRSGQFDQGVIDGVQSMIQVARGEFRGSPQARPTGRSGPDYGGFFPISLIFLLLVNMLGRIRKTLGALAGGMFFPILSAGFFHWGWAWTLLSIPLGLIAGFGISFFGRPLSFSHGRRPSSRSRGMWKGRYGGYGPFGGGFFGGGGFGGFSGGGGGFGGGGASGKW